MIEAQHPESSDKWLRRIAIAGIVAVAGCAIAWWFSPESFFQAWLAAAMLPWSVSLGSLILLLIFCLTGGRWGRAAWPWLALNARLMPLVALLFVPWIFGIAKIYPWANSDILQQFENTQNRQWLFQLPFVIGRTGVFFLVWSVLGWMVTGGGRSRRAIFTADEQPPMIVGGQAMAGLGLIAVLLTVTFAGIDWVMSFDPFFTSTLFGALIGMGALLSGMSAAVAAVCFWRPNQNSAVDDKTLGDLANLLLTFLMLWAYFSFAHFLIMWTGNLPIEASFYAARTVGIWKWISPLLSFGGFVVPLLCLLSYDFKRSPKKIGTLALCLIAVRLVELWWMVLPASGEALPAEQYWPAVPTAIAAAAIYLLALTWMMRRTGQTKPQEVIR